MLKLRVMGNGDLLIHLQLHYWLNVKLLNQVTILILLVHPCVRFSDLQEFFEEIEESHLASHVSTCSFFDMKYF